MFRLHARWSAGIHDAVCTDLHMCYQCLSLELLSWNGPAVLPARCPVMSADCPHYFNAVQADIYSFGVVLWELATGEAPQRGQLRDVKVPEECPLVRALFELLGYLHAEACKCSIPLCQDDGKSACWGIAVIRLVGSHLSLLWQFASRLMAAWC